MAEQKSKKAKGEAKAPVVVKDVYKAENRRDKNKRKNLEREAKRYAKKHDGAKLKAQPVVDMARVSKPHNVSQSPAKVLEQKFAAVARSYGVRHRPLVEEAA